MARLCESCDYFLYDFCDLYERDTDPLDTCDEYVCMDSDLMWESEEDDGYPD